MNDPAAAVTIALRIPGKWSHPRELVQRLPAGCRLEPEDPFGRLKLVSMRDIVEAN
jgi:hypothetical protein